MREIKFRVWETTKKYMIPFHQFGGFINPIDGGNNTTQLGFRDSLILMQYTGLKDRNGKEIYEGDFLKCKKNHDRVDFEIHQVTFDSYVDVNANVPYGSDWIIYGYMFPRDYPDIEVIGNIYENPNMIEV